MAFHSSETTIPAVHRADSGTTGLSVSSAGVTSVSVASVHAVFEAIPVSLKARFIYQQELKRRLLFSLMLNLW